MIAFLLAFMAITSFSRFSTNALIDQTKSDILTALTDARGKTLASKGNDIYGVHFETSKIVRFKGSSYATSSSDNVIYPIDSRVTIEHITLSGGGSNVTFARLTGVASKTGTIVISIVGDRTRRATTTISSSGIIE